MIPLNDLSRQCEGLLSALMDATERVYRRGYYCLGPEVEAFEEEFSSYCGVRFCTTVNSGTDALEIALRALGVGEGDHVVTTANAGGYSSTAIRVVGSRPRYVDVAPPGLDMSAAGLATALSERVSAVIATHLYGRVGNIVEIVELCKKHRVPLIEDCAHAHGAELDGRRAGSLGDIGCFSFYPTKNLGAAGDGGALVTSSEELYHRFVRLRQYGWQQKYVAEEPLGRNTRMDELQAAVLRAKLPLLDEWNNRRRRIAAAYHAGFSNVGAAGLTARGGKGDVVHLYVVRVKRRDAVLQNVKKAGVEVGIHYPVPDHLQPGFGPYSEWDDLSETERFCREILTLPCFPEMTDAEVNSVIEALLSCLL